MLCAMFIEERNQSRCILTIHHVNNKNEVRSSKLMINVAPFSLIKHCAKVVSREAQIQTVLAIDMRFSLPQRRQQAGANVENRDFHLCVKGHPVSQSSPNPHWIA